MNLIRKQGTFLMLLLAFLLFSFGVDCSFLHEQFTPEFGVLNATRPFWCGAHHEDEVFSNKRAGVCTKAPGTCASFCDNPTIRDYYVNALKTNLLDPITINVVVHTLALDTNTPASPESDAIAQEQILNQYFAPVGISFNVTYNMKVDDAYNAKIDQAWDFCTKNMVGDGFANAACLPIAMDGGDFICPSTQSCSAQCTTTTSCMYEWTSTCASAVSTGCQCYCVADVHNPVSTHYCTASLVGNGVCEPKCNFKRIGDRELNWDGGDCCKQNDHTKCLHPQSPLRSWIGSEEWKALFQSPGTDHLNIFVGVMNNPYLLGDATFPWQSKVFSQTGGVMFNTVNFAFGEHAASSKYGITAVHEIGHAFGLHHTFTGVSDLSGSTKSIKCQQNCYEVQPNGPANLQSSSTTGDLCGDTRPTPINFQCTDPQPCSVNPLAEYCIGTDWGVDCMGHPWINTPYRNFMGYANDECKRDEGYFTPHQMGRMRCYIDCRYPAWLVDKSKPSTIITPPTATTVNENQINVNWMAPLYLGPSGTNNVYEIWRSPRFEEFNTVKVDAASTTFTDFNISATTTYIYKVRMGGSNHFSPISNFAGFDPTIPTEPPPAPGSPTPGGPSPINPAPDQQQNPAVVPAPQTIPAPGEPVSKPPPGVVPTPTPTIPTPTPTPIQLVPTPDAPEPAEPLNNSRPEEPEDEPPPLVPVPSGDIRTDNPVSVGGVVALCIVIIGVLIIVAMAGVNIKIYIQRRNEKTAFLEYEMYKLKEKQKKFKIRKKLGSNGSQNLSLSNHKNNPQPQPLPVNRNDQPVSSNTSGENTNTREESEESTSSGSTPKGSLSNQDNVEQNGLGGSSGNVQLDEDNEDGELPGLANSRTHLM